jgi:hypothetical protein
MMFQKAGTRGYPRCCGKPMAFLGYVEAVPGRDETLKIINQLTK